MSATYELDEGIATITLDDGKVNALGPAMTASIGEALDQAERDEAVVIITGRERTFSAGFDLRVPGEQWPEMLTAGAELFARLLTFPRPTVAACNGNAIAAGALLLLSVDVRVGAERGKIGLNEVAIGLTLPYFALALARHRLTKPGYDSAAVTGAIVHPDRAAALGFLDQTASDPLEAAREAAAQLKVVDAAAHHATKLRVREDAVAGLRDGIERLQRGEP